MIDPCHPIWIAGNEFGAPCEACGHAIITHRLDTEHRGVCSVCDAVAEIRSAGSA